MATYMTKDRLGQTITKGQDNEGNPSVQIAGNLSPEDYQMQRQLNERADQERYASLNTPTYSGDPNRIAEENARSEMQRTGLDRYYHPNSAAYYAAFQGIRDKYLQQEMSKKSSIENEGKQLYSNRMGAFDKLIQDQYGIQKEKVESAGLANLRAAQTAEALAKAKSYNSDGMTPKERVADKKNTVTNILKQGDDMRAAIKEMITNAPTEHDRQVFTRSLGKLQGWINSDINAVKKGDAPTGLTEFNRWLSNTGSYTPRPIDAQPTQIQPPKAEGVKLAPEEPPKETANGMKYKTKTEALSAIKELSAADALNVMRANGITKDELREFLNPTKKQQAPRPVTGMPLSFS